jgi:CYTH domain-containing protein
VPSGIHAQEAVLALPLVEAPDVLRRAPERREQRRRHGVRRGGQRARVDAQPGRVVHVQVVEAARVLHQRRVAARGHVGQDAGDRFAQLRVVGGGCARHGRGARRTAATRAGW